MAEKVKGLSDYGLDQTNVGKSENKKQIDNLLVHLDRFLGKGATAKVYLGEYSYPGQPKNQPKKIQVAVKVISKQFIAQIPDYEEKQENEL